MLAYSYSLGWLPQSELRTGQMIVAIHQPNYLPWLGYFYKIANCDVFVFLDNVQYSKNDVINRNKIKTPQGEAWLTVGILSKGHYGQPINEVKINNDVPWAGTHWKSLAQNYRKAPYFREYEGLFENVYRHKWEGLADLNKHLTGIVLEILGIKGVKLVLASELSASGKSTELLINICKAVGGDVYLSGFGGKNYMDEAAFEKEGLVLRYYDFKHPTYSQLWGDFIPNLSIVDLLFNEGGRSLEILGGHAA